MLKVLSIIVVFVSLTVGCSQPKKPAHDVSFITYISNQDIKQFQYSESRSSKAKKDVQGHGGQRPGGKGGGANGKKGMGSPNGERSSKRGVNDEHNGMDRMRKHIEDKLLETGYCREGFMEIDHYNEAGQLSFKGQCNETATDNDRKNFKNQ